MNATLEIHRKSSFLACARRVHVCIDNQEVGAIANGKTASIELSPGRHVITTKLGLTSGDESALELAAGQTLRLICKIRMGLMQSSFALFREDGSKLSGDAGPARHHGALVLIFGILGFLLGIFGLAALIQGMLDLGKMSKGKMDSSGRVLTMIGMILGGAGFVLNLVLLIGLFMLHHGAAFGG
ncbi:MAG: hypothetical protein JO331_08000 [Verrucomicrobia bacterium]|nr:hypothetical protein [Verrucomicrobiota bacterium]